MAERSETQESSPEVELLVHIGAPSLGPDDARYRALASAYSNFKQKTRTKIPLREGPPNTQRSISDTQFSFEGVDDNLDSPYLPRGGARQDDPDTQASFVSLPSVVQDSIPDNLATFAGYGSPSRVLNFYTSSLDSDGDPQAPGVILAKAGQTGDPSTPSEPSSPTPPPPKPGQEAPNRDPTPAQHSPAGSSSPRIRFIQRLPPGRHYKREGIPPPDTSESSSIQGPGPENSSERRRAQRSPSEHTGLTPPSAQPRRMHAGITSTEESSSPNQNSPSLPRSTRRDYHPASRFSQRLASQRTPIAPRRRDEAPPSSSDAGQRVGNAGTPTRRLFTQTRPRPTAALNAIDPTDSDEPSLPPDRKRQRTGGSSADRRTKRRRTGAAPKPNDPDDDDDDDDDSDDEDPINPPPKTPRDKRLLGERYAQQSLYQRDWVFGPPMPIKETNEGKAIPLHPLDLFTPALDEVMGSLNGNHYMTASILRKLRHFERGYWIVDVRSWNDGLRRAFWNFLSEYIERGLAGWGVSAMRDRHNSTFTWVRLYGWGALAREMYLLLYLTSQRAVKGTGLCWYDAKHRVCVRMPTVEGGGPKESQRREGGPENVPAPPLGNVDHLLDGRPDPEALAEEPPAPKGTTPPPATPPPRPATPVYGSQTPPMGQGSPFRPRPQ